ncbi:MAG: V-type ATP synthase subunit I [bacterium]
MSKIQMVGPKAALPALLDQLYRFGKLQIEKSSYPEITTADKKTRTVSEYSLSEAEHKELTSLEELSGRCDELIEFFKPYPEVGKAIKEERGSAAAGSEGIPSVSVKELSDSIHAVETSKGKLARKLDEWELAEQMLEGYGKVIQEFISSESPNRHAIAAFAVEKGKEEVISLIKTKLDDRLNGNFDTYTGEGEKGVLITIVAVDDENLDKVRRLYKEEALNELPRPGECQGQPLSRVAAVMEQKREQLPKDKAAIENKIKQLGLKNAGLLGRTQDDLSGRLQYFRTLTKLAQTNFTFLLFGWVPSDNLADLKDVVLKTSSGSVILDELEIHHDEYEEVPVALNNGGYIKKFQPIVNLFARPIYGAKDPTSFLALFFPIFFGLMLGDMGYGLIILIGGFIMKSKAEKGSALEDISWITIYCGISTFIFGFVFAEAFGDLAEHFLGMHPMLDRAHDIKTPLYISVAIGWFHMLLAFIFKFTEAKKHAHGEGPNVHALEAIGSILALLSVPVFVLSSVNILPGAAINAGYLLVGLGLVMYIKAVGPIGALEMVGIMGNVLSYARIMAIGTASVMMAVVANMFVGKLNIFVGLLVAVLMHVINFALGVFGPALHGLRLHFVESFSKFMSYGKVEYQPFRKGGF